jgi:AcrR family transcriptional regulator
LHTRSCSPNGSFYHFFDSKDAVLRTVLETYRAGGTVVSITPKTELVIAALAPDRFPTVRAARARAIFAFALVTPVSTTVTLTQTGWQNGAEWNAAYEYLAGGNAELLTQLYQRFASGPIAWPNAQE